jgi:tetratricopeptide (TPR) repeat protein
LTRSDRLSNLPASSLIWSLFLLWLSSNSACVKNIRTVGNDNFYVLNGEKKKSSQKTQLHSGMTRPISKTPDPEGSKAKTNITNGDVVEEHDPTLASLIEKEKSDPTNAENHFQIASIYHRYRIFDVAYSEYQKAIERDAGNPVFYEGLGRLWRDSGAPQLGISVLEKALQLKSDLVEAWNSLGTIYDEVGNFAQAQHCYLKALESDPSLDFVHNNLCFSYLQIGEVEKAIYHGEKAVELNPGFAAAHNNLGFAYGMADDLTRALHQFSLAGDAAEAQNNLGVLLLKRQKNHEAMEHFRLAVKLKPFYKVATQNYFYARSLTLDASGNQKLGRVAKPDIENETPIDLASKELGSSSVEVSSNTLK